MKYNFKVKLPKKFKEKWVAKLRSREFKQTKNGNLVDNVGFCCLGVAGVVCKIPPDRMKHTSFITDNGFKIPKTVRKVLGQEMPQDSMSTVENHLANMNDGDKTFGQIARWIDKYL